MRSNCTHFIVDTNVYTRTCKLLGIDRDLGSFISIPKFVFVNNEKFTLDLIDPLAFQNNTQIETVIIPDSVTALPDRLFWKCSNLSFVLVGGTAINSIQYACFAYCENLKQVILPSSVNTIDEYAFYDCKKLSNINIPENLIRIKKQAFYGCENLTEIQLPKVLKTIEDSAFYGCARLAKCNLGNLDKIGNKAFYGCSCLSSIWLANDIKEIGDEAFSNCTWLQSISLPYDVEICGSNIFYGCDNIKTARIHDSKILNKSEEIKKMYYKYADSLSDNEITSQYKHFSHHSMPFSDSIIDVKIHKGTCYSDRYEWLSNLYLITKSGYYIQCKEICKTNNFGSNFSTNDDQPYEVFLDGILRAAWVYAFNTDCGNTLSLIKNTLQKGELTIIRNKNNSNLYHFLFSEYGYSWA